MSQTSDKKRKILTFVFTPFISVRVYPPTVGASTAPGLFNMRRGPPQLSSPRPHAVQPQNYPAGAASAARSTVSGEGVLRALLRQPARFTWLVSNCPEEQKHLFDKQVCARAFRIWFQLLEN